MCIVYTYIYIYTITCSIYHIYHAYGANNSHFMGAGFSPTNTHINFQRLALLSPKGFGKSILELVDLMKNWSRKTQLVDGSSN